MAEGDTVFGTANAPETLPAAIPVNGVITEWSFKFPNVSTIPSESSFLATLKILRPNGPIGGTIVGEGAPSQIEASTAQETSTFKTRIPVQAGDLIGEDFVLTYRGNTQKGAILCEGQDQATRVAAVEGSPTVGAAVTYRDLSGNNSGKYEEPGLGVPIVVKIEPDADGDGYGDETQDGCPTDAATHEACPVAVSPPSAPQPQTSKAPPITLGATAVAGKGHVVVFVTASGTTTASVSGTATLAKKKAVAVGGGSQAVGAGSPTRFVVALPAAVKARLKQLSSRQKLTVSLSVTAPGASTSVPLNVKLPGQANDGAPGHRRPPGAKAG